MMMMSMEGIWLITGEDYWNYVRFALIGHETTMKGEKLMMRESYGARALWYTIFHPHAHYLDIIASFTTIFYIKQNMMNLN